MEGDFCIPCSESEDEMDFCIPCSDIENHANVVSDSEDTESDEESPSSSGYATFCDSQQMEDDIYGLEEADIHETCTNTTQQSADYIVPIAGQKKRKPYTSDKRNLGNKRIRNKEQLKALDRRNLSAMLRSTCRCGRNCIGKLKYKQVFFERRLVHSLKRYEKKNYFLLQLKTSSYFDDNGKILKFRYSFHGQEVCAVAFEKIYAIGHNMLVNVRKMVSEGVQQAFPREAKVENGKQVLKLEMKAWFESWKHGRGNYMPDSPEFHLSPGLKKKDIYQAYLDEFGQRTRQYALVSKAYFYRIFNEEFPNVKKRRWVRFTKCNVCLTLEDKVKRSCSNQQRQGMSYTTVDF